MPLQAAMRRTGTLKRCLPFYPTLPSPLPQSESDFRKHVEAAQPHSQKHVEDLQIAKIARHPPPSPSECDSQLRDFGPNHALKPPSPCYPQGHSWPTCYQMLIDVFLESHQRVFRPARTCFQILSTGSDSPDFLIFSPSRSPFNLLT